MGPALEMERKGKRLSSPLGLTGEQERPQPSCPLAPAPGRDSAACAIEFSATPRNTRLCPRAFVRRKTEPPKTEHHSAARKRERVRNSRRQGRTAAATAARRCPKTNERASQERGLHSVFRSLTIFIPARRSFPASRG